MVAILPKRSFFSGLYSSIGLYESYEEEQLIQAKELLADLGLSHLIHRSYHVLSQGEKQFVMIARAMMAQPEYSFWTNLVRALIYLREKNC